MMFVRCVSRITTKLSKRISPNIRWTRPASNSYVQQEIAKFDSSLPVEKAFTPPSTWYTKQDFHALDLEAVFRQSWIAVGLMHKLQKPGDYITGFLADEPYLITRTPDDRICGYYNVCRHHATVLMDDSEGHAKQFQCPYHGWTYGLDGRLTKAKRLRGIQDFSAKDFCLKPLKTETWGPLLFLSLSDSNNDLQEWLQPLQDGLDQIGSSNMRFIERRQYKLGCNWKVFIDNYLDGGYHVEYAHKDLASLLNAKSYTITSYDGFSIQSGQGEDEEDGRIGSSVLYAHIFPNLMLNRYGPWLDVNYCEPVDEENCIVTFDWLLDEEFCTSRSEEELTEFVSTSLKASEQVQDEDIWLCERVQKGLRSRSYQWGRYAPKVEHADHDFHRLLAKAYKKHVVV